MVPLATRSGRICFTLSEVKSVQEDEAELKIEFADGSSATFRLEDPGALVAVRDRDNAVEYLG